jgi:hypothetical protein
MKATPENRLLFCLQDIVEDIDNNGRGIKTKEDFDYFVECWYNLATHAIKQYTDELFTQLMDHNKEMKQ